MVVVLGERLLEEGHVVDDPGSDLHRSGSVQTEDAREASADHEVGGQLFDRPQEREQLGGRRLRPVVERDAGHAVRRLRDTAALSARLSSKMGRWGTHSPLVHLLKLQLQTVDGSTPLYVTTVPLITLGGKLGMTPAALAELYAATHSGFGTGPLTSVGG